MYGRKVYRDILSVQEKNMPGPRGGRNTYLNMQWGRVSERISLCTFEKGFWKKGSMTVEASLIVPLMWYAISGFLYLLLVFRLQEDISQALADTGRELGQYVYSINSEEGAAAFGLVKGKQTIQSYCCKDRGALRFVEGGLGGIQLGKSRLLEEDAEIELVASYELQLPWILLGMKSIEVTQMQVCRAWVGYTGGRDAGSAETVVYVTPHGEKYHCSLECKYLSLSIQAVAGRQVKEQRNKDGERYASCESCCSGSADKVVYITDYGRRYHENLNCVGLKRTVEMKLLTEVQGRMACQACGNG